MVNFAITVSNEACVVNWYSTIENKTKSWFLEPKFKHVKYAMPFPLYALAFN